jgi:hypothetical protein
MGQAELMIVDHVFEIQGHGLFVTPAFDMPGPWKDVEELVTIAKPSGESFSVLAKFQRSHFRIVDPTVSGSPWKVIVVMPSETKASVPIGSRVFVSEAVKASLARG